MSLTRADIAAVLRPLEEQVERLRTEPHIVAVGQHADIPLAIASDGRCWRLEGRKWRQWDSVPLA